MGRQSELVDLIWLCENKVEDGRWKVQESERKKEEEEANLYVKIKPSSEYQISSFELKFTV